MKTNITKNLLLLSSALVFGLSACNNTKKNPDTTEIAEKANDAKMDNKDLKDDFDFAVEAADGSLFEVMLGKLAVANGTSLAVKEFGQTMIKEHGQAATELEKLAHEKDITTSPVLSEKCQKKYDALAQKSGSEFDKEYSSLMVSDHKDDLDAFKKEAKDGKDPDLKAWANGKIAMLEHHLDMAKTAKDAVKR